MSAENSPDSREKVGKGKPPVEHQFKPGQSGNPGGRKKAVISQIYEKILADPENQAAIEQSVLKMLLGGRMSGQLQLKEMAERTEGKIAQSHHVDGDITISTLSERLKKARELVGE